MDLGNGRGRPTWIQKTVYFKAKSYWDEVEREKAQSNTNTANSGVSGW